MKKWITQTACTWLVVFTVCGCVDNGKSLVVLFQVAPDSDCVYEVDGDYYRSRGYLDLGHLAFGGRPSYRFYAQVNNYMPNSSDVSNGESNAFDVHLTKAVVEYEWLKGREEVLAANPALLQVLAIEDLAYTDYFNAYVSAGDDGGEAGKTVFGFFMVPPEIGELMVQLDAEASKVTLGVRARLYGETIGGLKVETGEFFYAIDLCWGCLYYVCCLDTPSLTDDYYPACRPGQDTNDLLVDGCECDSTYR